MLDIAMKADLSTYLPFIINVVFYCFVFTVIFYILLKKTLYLMGFNMGCYIPLIKDV